jgi:hypothetical protein
MNTGQNIIVCTPHELTLLIEQAVAKTLAQQQPEQEVRPDGKAPLIDRDELCKRLDVSPQTIINLEKKKKLPSYRVGDAARYDWEQVKQALLYKRK